MANLNNPGIRYSKLQEKKDDRAPSDDLWANRNSGLSGREIKQKFEAEGRGRKIRNSVD